MKIVAIYVEGYERGVLGTCWKVFIITPEGNIRRLKKDYWYHSEAVEKARKLSKEYNVKVVRPATAYKIRDMLAKGKTVAEQELKRLLK